MSFLILFSNSNLISFLIITSYFFLIPDTANSQLRQFFRLDSDNNLPMVQKQLQSLFKKPVSLNFQDLSTLRKGQAKPFGDWTSEILIGYWPQLLGGYHSRWQVIQGQLLIQVPHIIPSMLDIPEFSNLMGNLDQLKANKTVLKKLKIIFLNYCLQNASYCTNIIEDLGKTYLPRDMQEVNTSLLSPLEKLYLISSSNSIKAEIQRLMDSAINSVQTNRLAQTDQPIEWWTGKCHLTPYVMTLFPHRPNNLTLQGVTLYTGDFNALLHLVFERINKTNWNSFLRIFGRTEFDQSINPALFFVILTNVMGLYHQQYGVVADIAKGPMVWNHYVKSYRILKLVPIEKHQVQDHYQQADLDFSNSSRRTIHFLADSFFEFEIKVVFADMPSVTYQGVIELHQSTIVGGQWLSDNAIDFLWVFNHRLINVSQLIQGDPLSQFIYDTYLQAM